MCDQNIRQGFFFFFLIFQENSRTLIRLDCQPSQYNKKFFSFHENLEDLPRIHNKI